LPIGIDARLQEERLVRSVAEHRGVAAAVHFLLGERAAGQHLREAHVDEALGHAHDDVGRRAVAAVEHALHRRLRRAAAEPRVDERHRGRQAADGFAVVGVERRPAQQLEERRAGREADGAETLHEDGLRGRASGSSP
jgi:hypothetical protein